MSPNRLEEFDETQKKRYEMIKQSMDYQMSEIVKEIDNKKSSMSGGPRNSPGRLHSKSLFENNNSSGETRTLLNKKDTMI